MNIALIITPQKQVPPVDYGGHERQADIIVRKLMEMGHRVDLYCGEGSTCKASNLYTVRNPDKNPNSVYASEEELAKKLVNNDVEYDGVIDFTDFRLLNDTDVNYLPFFMGDDFRLRPHDNIRNRVYCSKEMAYNWNSLDNPIIPNSFYYDKSDIPFYENDEGYGLYVGSITPKKGVHLAAVACKKANIPFMVYGPIADTNYWNQIKGLCVYGGLLGKEYRWDIFGKAFVFLHFPAVCDAGPLAPQEAMACGVPVVAAPHGGICSSINDGVSGFFAYTVQDVLERFSRVSKLDRKSVRESVFKYADTDNNVKMMLDLIKRIKNGASW